MKLDGKFLAKIKQHRIASIFIGLVTLVVVGLLIYDLASTIKTKYSINEDLHDVAIRIERFKSDTGHYPSEAELGTTFAKNPRYQRNPLASGRDYGYSYFDENNFFYCKKDTPNAYMVGIVVQADFYYITNSSRAKVIDYHPDKNSNSNIFYPDVHMSASASVCPAFLPGFTDSANGWSNQNISENNNGWEPWTGLQ